jgi:hypothetical protein
MKQWLLEGYKPHHVHSIHCRPVSERGVSLFLLLLPTSPSRSTWVWEYLIVAREEKEQAKEHFAHGSGLKSR